MTSGREARDPRHRTSAGGTPDRGRSLSLGWPLAQPDRGAIKMVLVVDDEAEIREILAQYLIRIGLIPIPVPNGAHAQVVCKTLAPDAVLLDLGRLDTDRLALIRQIKTQRPGTPVVVMMSGLLDGKREAQCRAEGADALLPKPIDLKHLGQVLARLLRLPEERPPGPPGPR
jgi:CheY-like chemotaxis protein